MQHTALKKMGIVGKKFLSMYFVTLMLLASFAGMLPSTQADMTDVITTYCVEGPELNQTNIFDEGDMVVVNVSVDNATGDPPSAPPYVVNVSNQSGGWILVTVFDNDTGSPLDAFNQENDSCYFGVFSIGLNATNQTSQPPYLHVENGEWANITEDFDEDPEVGWALIFANYSGGQQNHPPNQPTNPNPPNSAEDVPLDAMLTWDCTDPDGGGDLTFDVYFGTTSPPTKNVSNQSAFIFDPTLAYNTLYFWKIVVWDSEHASNMSEVWSFTTEEEGSPPGGNGTVCGYVRDSNMTGISSAVVYLNGTVDYYVLTNASGYFIFDNNVSAGMYSPSAMKPSQFEVYEDAFNLSSGQVYWVNFTVGGGGPPPGGAGNGSVCGFVLDENDTGISSATVMLDGSSVYFAHTGFTGYFIFDNNVSEGMYQTVVYVQGQEPYNGDSVEVVENQTTWVNFTIGGGGPPPGGSGNSTIHGYVLDQDTMEAIADATVEIFKAPDYNDMTQTNGTGHYAFTNLEAGTYDLRTYKAEAFPSHYQNGTMLGDNETVMVNFTVSTGGGGGVTGDNVSFQGFVYQDMTNNLPIEEANVTVYTFGNPADVRGWALTDSEGFFNLTFSPNMTAVNQGNEQVTISASKEGYVTNENTRHITDLMYQMNPEMIFLTRIYDITCQIYGAVVDDLGSPIEEVTVNAEGDDYFHDHTTTAENGTFTLGVISGELMVMFFKNGYFSNESEVEIGNESTYDLGIITLDVRPADSAYIEGYVTCEGVPLANVELSLYDPDHPFDMKGGMPPTTNDTGYYNLSTYAGEFILVTLARMIGMRMDGPPLGIGGYVNEIAEISISENQTLQYNFSLEEADPDEILVDVNFSSWDECTVQMQRTVTANAAVIRMMADTDLDGTVSVEEAAVVLDDVLAGLSDSMMFSEIAMLVSFPFELSIDSEDLIPENVTVEAMGLNGSLSGLLTPEPIIFYVNGTYTFAEPIDDTLDYHHPKVHAYYGNPAFTESFTITFPEGFIVQNARQEMVSLSGIGTRSVAFTAAQDPDIEDTEYYESVHMFVGNTTSFASFYDAYSYENPIDTDGDGKYNYLQRKIKFNTSSNASFALDGTLREPAGTTIDQQSASGSYFSGTNTVMFWFRGENIYKSHEDGPYTAVFDLYCSLNGTTFWFDSINQTTANYTYTQFDAPAIYFTGEITDYGYDTDDDGLYNYLIFDVGVDVGTTGYYEFEGDTGIAMMMGGGDPHIAHLMKTETFSTGGLQTVSISVEGSQIYEKQTNSSLWFSIWVYNPQYGQLDYINYMTDTYYYEEFELPPPENSSVRGNITDVYGDPIHAQVRLRDRTTWEENTTDANASGWYWINSTAGGFELEVWSFEPGVDNHWEYIVLEENETVYRDIKLVPYWHQTERLNIWMDDWQYAAGDLIYVNGTAQGTPLPDSPVELMVYLEVEVDGFYSKRYVTTETATTDENGTFSIAVNSTEYANGDYRFEIILYNETQQRVCRDDRWLQISSFSLDFYLDKGNYRPGATGTGTYNFTYSSNSSWVQDASYVWKIMYYDWSGEHVVAQGEFTNASGHGTFTFTIPVTIDSSRWYDLRLTASKDDSEINAWAGFGIVTGTCIEQATDAPVGTPGDYDGLLINVTINVTTAGAYRVEGGLNGQNWEYITSNQTQTSSLTVGSHTIPLYFEGQQIQESSIDPYKAWIGLYQSGQWSQLDSMDYILQNTYQYDEFAQPDTCFVEDGFTVVPIGPENNYEALNISVNITSSVQGTYRVEGNLHKRQWMGNWWQWTPVSWSNTEVIIDENNVNSSVNVTISFAGQDLYNSQQNGPWNINFNLQRDLGGGYWNWIDDWSPDDEINYDYDQFTKPAAYIEGIVDQGAFNGDLWIDVLVNVTEGYEGDYEIQGNLHSNNSNNHMWITNAWNQTTLTNGSNTVSLYFPGEAIYGAGYNGTYLVWVEIRQMDPWNWLGGREYETNYHTYDEFSAPGAMFTGNHTDGGYDEDNDGYYDALNVTAGISFSETGFYEIQGELYLQSGWQWNWITWSHTELTVTQSGVQDITVAFSGYEIRNRGLNGYYGVRLRLRDINQGTEIDYLDFTSTTYYSYDDFELPAVFFTPESPLGDELSPDASYINISLEINASDVGTYHVNGNLHKVINQGGWYQWIWLTHASTDVTISETGITPATLSFDTAMIQSSGYNGPYTVDIQLNDENWMMIDSIQEYQTQAYNISGFAPSPINFTGAYYDYLSPAASPDYIKVNVTVDVATAGNYHFDGCLHKEISWNWNHLAGNGFDQYLNTGEQNVTFQFDVVEILNNIQMLGLESIFETGTTIDIDTWVRRSGQWSDLDQLSGDSVNTYYLTDFTGAVAAALGTVTYNGYNQAMNNETEPYDYLNITVPINFTQAGDYELWCDLNKESPPNWYWLGWENTYITITSAQVADGYEVETVTLQFSGTRLADYDSPYRYHMELRNLGTNSREAMKEGQITGFYGADFTGSTITFDDGTQDAWGVDTDDPDDLYNYLLVCVNITAAAQTNVVVSADLHKEQNGPWQWIGWKENYTTLGVGSTNVSLLFDGETIYNSGVNGPWQIRLEVRDSTTWEMLDVIDSFDTPSYLYTNFQTPSASLLSFEDCGNDTDLDGLYNTLDVNVTVSTQIAGTYEITGDLHSETNGWYWLGWESTGFITLPEGNSTVKLQFDGIQIRSSERNGPYYARIELRDSEFRTLDIYDRYETNSYLYTEFQSSGATLVDNDTCPSDRGVGTPGSYDYLEVNVTVDCSVANVTYWVGVDLHKEGWQWTWIDFQSQEFTAVEGEQVIQILFPGELIRNSGVNGPYQCRVELRDTATWTTQDMIQMYNTQTYSYTDFKEPTVFFVDDEITDWGNDTDYDGYYNYLDVNITITCTQAGTYWLHGDLHKQTGYMWTPIAWEGHEITLDDSGDQLVKLQFNGEQISASELNGPYQLRLELQNINTGTRYDIIEQYNTESYFYTDFQTSLILFVEETGVSPVDRGVGTQGSYTYLEVNVTVDSAVAGTYWLGADLHKKVNYFWMPIAWYSTDITHTGSGEEVFTILFDGSTIRNSGLNGPYEVRLELRNTTTWDMLDIIEEYDTAAYSYTDFLSAGIELVEKTDATADSIVGGNLQLNVSVDSTAIGMYELRGTLYKQSGYNWWFITSETKQISVAGSGLQHYALNFSGEDIFQSQRNGPYQIRVELWKTGTWTMVDSFEGYDTSAYSYMNFSAPSAGINETATTDYAPEYEYLQVNVTTYSATSTEYQVSIELFNSAWQFIAWNATTQTISGYNQLYEVRFDASVINNSGLDPAKIYIEMRRTSDGQLIDWNFTDLSTVYDHTLFSAGVSIDSTTLNSNVSGDGNSDGYNDSLNLQFNFTTTTPGDYGFGACLKTQTGMWITGTYMIPQYYAGGITETINLTFAGMDIYTRGLDGPYTVAFISVAKNGTGEILRLNNAHTTDAYSYLIFDRPDMSANLSGTYTSYAWDLTSNGDYEYLVVNVTVDIGVAGDYYFFGDLYADNGSTWVSADKNDSVTLDTGEHIVKMYFEGNDIYDSLTDGPYLLGYIWVGAYVGETLVILDSANNVLYTASYDYDEFNATTQAPLVPSNVQSITCSNDPFSPNSDGSKDTTGVTVTADAGQTLYLNIYNSTNVIKRTSLPLSGSGTSYTASWNGKDDSNSVVAEGTYRIKVSDEASSDPAHESDVTTTVDVDLSAPTGATITINSGATYTNTTSVTLTVTATDASNKKMRFKNGLGDYTDWEDFQTSKSWTLYASDGTRTVNFQVKDVADNIASAVSDTITLDTVKPANVTINITGSGDTPATYSNSVSVTLTIAASDATSGLYQMMIANDVAFTGASWETYSTTKSWTLTSGDGTKTVYLKVKDYAGLIADTVSDTIILDTTEPSSLTVSIQSGQTYTNTTTVNITVSATGAAKMAFSRNGTSYTSWETYATSKTWTLYTGDGTKTVYFKAKDTAGNVATAVSDTIILDTTAPTISSVASGSLSQTGATITWTTGEASDSQVEYGLTTGYGSSTTLDETDVTSHSVSLSGLTPGTTYHYRVKSRDAAGNLGTSTDNTLTTNSGVDTTPPAAISGLTVTDKDNAEATLTLSWTESSASDFAAYKVYRRTSSFTNVSLSGVQLLTTITEKTTTTYDDTTATDDTTFYYAVTAIDTASPPNENQTVSSVSGVSYDDVAPTTTDNIPTGWQRNAVTVTLTAVDNGKGVNKTYYTTDGSSPKNGSNAARTLYSAPFSIGGDNTLGDGHYNVSYYSYDKNSTINNESTHTKWLKVDTTNPTTTLVRSPTGTGWQKTSVTVTLSATDVTSGVYKIQYTTDGSAPTNSSTEYSTPITFSSQGNTTFKFRTRDNAGNVETYQTAYIKIDTTAPTSSVTTLPAYSSSPFDVSWTSADALSGVKNVTIQVRNGTGGSWTDWLTGQAASGTQSYPDAAIGYTYYFRSVAYDNALNAETAPSSPDAYTAVVGSAPTADISSPADSDGDGYIYIRATVTFTGNATDANFSKYWLNYSADGTTWTTIESSTTAVEDGTLGEWNTTALTEMAYNISLAVKNLGGYFNYYNLSNITVDNTVPEITSVSSGTPTSSTATITWTTNEDANSTVQYGTTTSYGSTSTSTSYTTSHSRTLSGLSASTTYHYRVVSYDRAGNLNNSTDGTFTTVAEEPPGGGGPPVSGGEEDVAPTISAVTHLPATITSSNYVAVYATVTDDNTVSSVVLYWSDGTTHSQAMDAGASNEYTTEIGPFMDGLTVTYWIIATDNASQTTRSANYTFTVVDQAGPTISGLTPASSAVISDTTPTIGASYSDPSGVNVNTVFLIVDAENVTAQATITSSQVSYSPTTELSLGQHTVTVSVSDTKKNKATTTWSFTIQIEILEMNETIEELLAGETTEISLENTDIGIDTISITAAYDLTGVSISVERLEEAPEDVTEPTAMVYAYLNIESTAPEGSIESLSITFKVEQTWFAEQGIDKEDIVLMRYHDNAWEQLDTTMLSEDATYVYYQATATGMSTFAIAVGEQLVTPAAEVPLIFIALLVLVLAVIAFVVLAYYRRVE